MHGTIIHESITSVREYISSASFSLMMYIVESLLQSEMHATSGVTCGRAGGRVPPTFFTGKFLLTYREKRRKGKWRGKEGKFEREEVGNWKWNGGGKGMNMKRGPFFLLSLFETTEICLGLPNFTIYNFTKCTIFCWYQHNHHSH